MLRVLKLLFLVSGIAFIVWAFFNPHFRDAEGFLEGIFCLPISFGVALMVLGCGLTGRLKQSAFWFALALVGQAVALQMLDAGPHTRYQHYKPFGTLLNGYYPLFLIFFAVQTILVGIGLINRREKIKTWLIRNFKPWQFLGIGIVIFLFSASMSSDISRYLAELFFAAFVQIVNLGNIVLMVWALPAEAVEFAKQKLDKIFGRSETEETGKFKMLDGFALCAAAWVTVFAAMLCVLSYEKHPHIPDELSYIYQARYFSKGMITMPAPQVPEAFNMFLMDNENGKWYSTQLPGWPAILSLGVLVGLPWLVNPILAGLNILLTYLFIRGIYDRRTARVTVLLLCFSPWYVFMAMNFMGHTFALTCALIAAVSVVWARRTDKAIWGWIGGFSLGILSLIRPLEALASAGLLGLWAIGIGGRRLKISAIAGLVIGSIIVGSVGLYYNKLITGDPTRFPFSAYTDKYIGPGSNALGFGPGRGFGWHKHWKFLDPYPGHSPIESLINTNLNLFAVNTELYGWSTGSLALIAILLFSGKTTRNDRIMLAAIGAIIGIHSFYWFSGGPDFGARYWYLIIVPCVALTARSIQYLSGILGSSVFAVNNSSRVLVGVLSLCIIALLNYFPWRAIDKYHHYRGFRPGIRRLANEFNFGKSLILVRGNNYNNYPSAAIYNQINLHEDKPIYAWDKNPEIRKQLLQSFPDRKLWIVNGPSITGKGFEVVGGPLSSQEMLLQ